jgi:hypothetical protein
MLYAAKPREALAQSGGEETPPTLACRAALWAAGWITCLLDSADDCRFVVSCSLHFLDQRQ